MGFMMATARCFGCKTMFCFNPDLVPSIRVNAAGQPDPKGEREPVCRVCIERVNPIRITNGLQPIVIPHGAYAPQEVQ